MHRPPFYAHSGKCPYKAIERPAMALLPTVVRDTRKHPNAATGHLQAITEHLANRAATRPTDTPHRVTYNHVRIYGQGKPTGRAQSPGQTEHDTHHGHAASVHSKPKPGKIGGDSTTKTAHAFNSQRWEVKQHD